LSTYIKSLFGGVSNNQNYLKNILRKTCTKKLYFGAPEEEEEDAKREEKFSFGS